MYEILREFVMTGRPAVKMAAGNWTFSFGVLYFHKATYCIVSSNDGSLDVKPANFYLDN